MPSDNITSQKAHCRDDRACLPKIAALLILLFLSLLLPGCSNGKTQSGASMGSGGYLYYPSKPDGLKWGTNPKLPKLVYCQWLPPASVCTKAVIIAVPGLDQSCNEWAPLGRYLSAHGYEVYSTDLRDQGLDDTVADHRGNYHNWKQWVVDVQAFHALKLHGRKLPVAYVGLSLGSLVALAAATSDDAPQPDALVLESPAFVLAYPPSIMRPLLDLTEIFTLNGSRMTTPDAFRLGAKFGGKPVSIISNADDEEKWEASKDRVCKGFSPRYFLACLDIGKHDRMLPQKWKKPVMTFYGRSDITYTLSQRSPDQIAQDFGILNNKEDYWYHPNPKANHDMLDDSDVRTYALQRIASWLDQKLPKHP